MFCELKDHVFTLTVRKSQDKRLDMDPPRKNSGNWSSVESVLEFPWHGWGIPKEGFELGQHETQTLK